MRRTKIVCTLGPASDEAGGVERLIASGMDAARLNFSHGSHEDHARRLAGLRRAAAEAGKSIAVIQDLAGPKIRCGVIAEGGIDLEANRVVTIEAEPILGCEDRFSTTYHRFVEDVSVGDEIFLDDGQLKLVVEEKESDEIRARVIRPGRLTSHKGVNLPGTPISSPSVTDKDLADLEFGLAHGVDYVACSFVRRAEDLRQARELIEAKGSNARIIAKIEKPHALEEIDAIADASDALMVARGDLGVEMPVTQVPGIQRDLIALAHRKLKPVIVATQMLQSMIDHSQPTRAEVSDISTAILTGSDALMLSGETAVGRFPAAAVRMMDAVAREAETYLVRHKLRPDWIMQGQEDEHLEAVVDGAAVTAEALSARLIVLYTHTGRTARFVSKNRSDVPVLAVTPDAAIARRMALYWGIIPHCPGRTINNVSDLQHAASDFIAEKLPEAREKPRVLLFGQPFDSGTPINTITVVEGNKEGETP